MESYNCDEASITSIFHELNIHENECLPNINDTSLDKLSGGQSIHGESFPPKAAFCIQTVGALPSYFTYTLGAVLMPILINIILLSVERYRNGKYSIIYMFENFSRRRFVPHDILTTGWVLILVTIYPIITKRLYAKYEFEIIKLNRKCEIMDKERNACLYHSLVVAKSRLQKKHEYITQQMIISSVAEVVTEATLQPIVQLYSLSSMCTFLANISYERIVSFEFIINPQFRSVLTSIVGFAWSLTSYHVYTKNGALDLDINLTGRVLLFLFYFMQITGRLYNFAIAGHQIFVTFNYLVIFLACHIITMGCIHVHYMRTLKLTITVSSLEFWLELFLNACGSLLVSCNINCRRVDRKNNLNNNIIHFPTREKYLLMDTFIIIESMILLFISGFAGDASSRMASIFDRSLERTIWTILICLLLLLFGLLLKLIYYQKHQWPISLCSSIDTFDVEQMLTFQESNLTNFDMRDIEEKDVYMKRNELGHKKNAKTVKIKSMPHLEEKIEPGRQNKISF